MVFMEEGLPELGSVSDLALFIQNYFVFGRTNVFERFISLISYLVGFEKAGLSMFFDFAQGLFREFYRLLRILFKVYSC